MNIKIKYLYSLNKFQGVSTLSRWAEERDTLQRRWGEDNDSVQSIYDFETATNVECEGYTSYRWELCRFKSERTRG